MAAAKKTLKPEERDAIAHNHATFTPLLLEKAAAFVLVRDPLDKEQVESSMLRAYDFLHSQPDLVAAPQIEDALGVSPAQARMLVTIKHAQENIQTLVEEELGLREPRRMTKARSGTLVRDIAAEPDPMAGLVAETVRTARKIAISPTQFTSLEDAEKAVNKSRERN